MTRDFKPLLPSKCPCVGHVCCWYIMFFQIRKYMQPNMNFVSKFKYSAAKRRSMPAGLKSGP